MRISPTNVLLGILLSSRMASSSPIAAQEQQQQQPQEEQRPTSDPTPSQFHGVLIARGAQVDWPGLLQDNVSWALVEATRGNSPNADYGKWWQLAQNTPSFLRGAYHIAEPVAANNHSSNGSESGNDDAAAQARLFVQQSSLLPNGSSSGSRDGTTFPATLRIGLDPPAAAGADPCFAMSPAALTAWLATWIATYTALTGHAHVAINMQAAWWAACTGDTTAFAHDHLLFYRSFGTEPHGGLGGWMQAPAIGHGALERGGDLYLWDQGFNIDIGAWARGEIAPPPGGEF